VSLLRNRRTNGSSALGVTLTRCSSWVTEGYWVFPRLICSAGDIPVTFWVFERSNVMEDKRILNGAAEADLLTHGREGDGLARDCPAVLARARAGDAEAFDQLYRMHRARVFALCHNLCGNREQAEDLLQETFVRAWRGLSKFRGGSSFQTWLYRIATNVCRDATQRNRPPPPDPPRTDAAAVQHVREIIAGLRPPYRVALALRYTLSLSYRDIAEVLHWSLPRVKMTLHRARQAFKDAYENADEVDR